ncbi:MAG TPA: haloacid dehalogenase type II [Candidatus Limnocylindria bacterium]|nr:haloacid dehalogenase type II [Candidatus Limnocylindria bacterium]
MPDGLDFGGFEALTFDCYGTLIDWEAGILGALRPILTAHDVALDDEALLAEFAQLEAQVEAGPYRPYRDVLRQVLIELGDRHGFSPDAPEADAFAASVAEWPAFPDSAAALAALGERFGLGVITNCDDDLFAASNRRLGEPFRWVITAQQAHSYKPSHRNFEMALERMALPPEKVLHVAQSLYHDHGPAHELGLRSVWVNRRSGRAGSGATPPASATFDLEVPDMATLARMAVG